MNRKETENFVYIVNNIQIINDRIREGTILRDKNDGIIQSIEYKYKSRRIIVNSLFDDRIISYMIPDNQFKSTFLNILEG